MKTRLATIRAATVLGATALATIAFTAITLDTTSSLFADDGKEEVMPGPTHPIHFLNWMSGTWRSPVDPKPTSQVKAGTVWETVYTSHMGDEILSATKGMKGGEVFLYDFERFFKRGDDVILVPFPGGKQSVEFKLVDFDASVRKAVFVNPEHDFPKKLVYEIDAKDHFVISVLGDGDEGFKLDLVRAR